MSEARRLSWPDVRSLAGSETVYDVIDGALDQLSADAGFSRSYCLVSMTQAASYVDSRPTVPPGSYFLVRARNSCGHGSTGDASVLPDPRDSLDAGNVCP